MKKKSRQVTGKLWDIKEIILSFLLYVDHIFELIVLS